MSPNVACTTYDDPERMSRLETQCRNNTKNNNRRDQTDTTSAHWFGTDILKKPSVPEIYKKVKSGRENNGCQGQRHPTYEYVYILIGFLNVSVE